MLPRFARTTGLLAILLSACAQTPETVHQKLPLPPYPADESLIEFAVSDRNDNRFFIEEASLEVNPDRDIQYSLVVEAPGGARTVTREAIRCQSAEYRILAIGRRDRSWSEIAEPTWRRIEDTGLNRQRAALALEYFCEGPASVIDRDEALWNLRNPNQLRLGVSSPP